MTITVVVADDDPLVRSGIGMLLSADDDIEIVGEAADGRATRELVDRTRPDVVLMDVRMPGEDGIAATRAITADPPHSTPDRITRVIVLTTFGHDTALYGALRAGASGFVLKHAANHDLVPAVRRVAQGEVWIDPAVAGRLVLALGPGPGPTSQADAEALARLTPREHEILRLVAEGLTNADIVARLVLSLATVKTHVARIVTKTGCHDRAQAVSLAYRCGLMSDLEFAGPTTTPPRQESM